MCVIVINHQRVIRTLSNSLWICPFCSPQNAWSLSYSCYFLWQDQSSHSLEDSIYNSYKHFSHIKLKPSFIPCLTGSGFILQSYLVPFLHETVSIFKDCSVLSTSALLQVQFLPIFLPCWRVISLGCAVFVVGLFFFF